MTLRRRIAFATPFVVVVACKRPVAPVDEPVPTPLVHDAAVDAPGDASIDGRVADARLAGPPVERECGKDVTCNPPPPSVGVIAKMVDVRIEGGVTVIQVSKGHEDGVEMSWSACFLDDRDRCIEGAPLTVRHVGEKRTTLVLTATDIAYDRRVRLRAR